MVKYSFIVGEPLPSPGITGLYRLAHVEAPVFSCFMCLPDLVPEVLRKIPAVLALGADDMRHLDGWVFFNFKIHADKPDNALIEPKLIGLLSRASILFDLHMGHDMFDTPRHELGMMEEDALNPSFDVHMGIFEGSEVTLENSLVAAFPDGWEAGWMYSGKVDNGVVSLCLHLDTGLRMCVRAMTKPYFDETNMRIALTDEQRSRLQAQGKMFYSMQMGSMHLMSDFGRPRVVAQELRRPPELDLTRFPGRAAVPPPPKL